MFSAALQAGKGLALKSSGLAPVGKSVLSSIRALSTVNSGRVKWFDSQKGYGFIIPDDGGDDLFVHQTSVYAEGYRSLGEGEEVEFEVYEEPGGRTKAVNVTGPNGAYVKGAQRSDDDFRGGRY
mmetsp:Transcript_7373/g.8467  ORF Transcript_7373/g.8467 Transcript_7373/m.8467 type:complete len:124 (+) Transcript_7373:155-526(+)